ncbi:MAG: type II CAAX endopeptidase family protein [Methylococcales bacterium]
MNLQKINPATGNQLALYYILVSLGIGILGSLANHILEITSTDLPYLLTLIGLSCLVVWLGFVSKRYDALTLGFSRLSWGSTLSLFIWLTIVGEGITAFTLTWFPEQMVEQLLIAFTPESVWSWVLFLVMASFVAPIGEELVFRGFILNSYAQAIGAHRAVWISAILFGLAHHSPPHVVAAFFSGLVFARFMMAGGSLWTSMIAHGLINFSSTVMMQVNHSPLIFPEYETTAVGGIIGLLIAIIATFLFFQYYPVTRSAEPEQKQSIMSAALIGYLIITFSLVTMDFLSTLSESPVTIPVH